jgi:acetyltransferase EpsM
MKNVIIVGAGGHAAELRDYIRHINQSNPDETIKVEGFIDDDPEPHKHYGYEEPLLGGIQDHEIRHDLEYLMGIANLKYRKDLMKKFLDQGATFARLIHPTSIISPSAKLGQGVVISHNASVGPKAEVGDYSFINSRSTVGHDTKIGKYNFISPQVALGGNTQIGDGNLLGTNCCTIPGVKIGNDNKVGAGMIVFKPVGDNETVFFRFKEKIIVRESGEEGNSIS